MHFWTNMRIKIRRRTGGGANTLLRSALPDLAYIGSHAAFALSVETPVAASARSETTLEATTYCILPAFEMECSSRHWCGSGEIRTLHDLSAAFALHSLNWILRR
jgi:hypothetical protein